MFSLFKDQNNLHALSICLSRFTIKNYHLCELAVLVVFSLVSLVPVVVLSQCEVVCRIAGDSFLRCVVDRT